MNELIKNLTNNIGYLVLVVFIVTRLSSFKRIIQKDEFKIKDALVLSCIFGGFGVFGTYIGTDINGAIANTRITGIMVGGILCGPFVGISAGIIAGIHRLLIDLGGITSVPCSIATVAAGGVSGIIYKWTKDSSEDKWHYGLIGGLLMQSLEMLLILLISRPFSAALEIVKEIYVPMGFINAIGIPILIMLIQSIFEEKDEIAARQAKIALDIASETLPYFRDLESGSFDKICEIIKDAIGADAVAITDRDYVLAHVGMGIDHHIKGQEIQTQATERVIKNGEILMLKSKSQINCAKESCPLKSAIIVPLKEDDEVIGTLKIYYSKENAISYSSRNLAIGLSQIISTQLEISRVGKLKEMATKAEIKALQAQINPHFLFNALNTIISFVRINPNKARELIINLSTYLRYNIESEDNLVDIYKELEQVKAYVEIEKARFGDKLNVIYNIDEDIDIKIPSLIIQPIVENSIKHGILKDGNRGTVKIEVKKLENNKVKILVQDDGVGISEDIIKRVYENKMQENKIGISNVYNRLKYIYGKGFQIERLDKGTRTTFVLGPLKG